MCFKVHSSSIGVRIPADSPVRDLITSTCLRQTMNLWFSHGQDVHTELPAEVCCSACMKRCILDTGCLICKERIKGYEPSRNPVNLSKLESVKSLAGLLHKVKASEFETPYNVNSLSEAVIENIIENQSIDSFEGFLEMFSLSAETSSTILEFVKSNLNEIVTENQMGGFKSEESATEDESNDSNSSHIDDTSRDDAFIIVVKFNFPNT